MKLYNINFNILNYKANKYTNQLMHKNKISYKNNQILKI